MPALFWTDFTHLIATATIAARDHVVRHFSRSEALLCCVEIFRIVRDDIPTVALEAKKGFSQPRNVFTLFATMLPDFILIPPVSI